MVAFRDSLPANSTLGNTNRHRLFAVFSVAALSLSLAACGNASDEGGGDDGLTEISVGAIPIGDTAALHIADQQGFFEEEGLDVEIVETSGGAIAVPGVESGDYDFAFGNTVSLMVAQDQGLDLRYVTNGATTTGEPGEDFAAVVAPEDSQLESSADLTGGEASSNNLNNIGDLSIRLAADKDGGNGADIEFVELGFGEAQAAVENGNVEAALILEPFLTPALDAGLKPVSWPYAEAHPEFDIGGFFTRADYFDEEPETVEAFSSALNKALEYSEENPDEVREVIGSYIPIEDEVLEEMVLPKFTSEFSREGLQEMGEAAVEYGVISEEPDIDALLPPEN